MAACLCIQNKSSCTLLGLHFDGSLLLKMDEERKNEMKQVITLLCDKLNLCSPRLLNN
jgi:hypothetical protein